MRGLFWVLGLFALAVAVSLGAQLNDGYVLFVFPKWLRLEVSLNLFIVALVLLLILSYWLVRAIGVMLALPERARAFQAQRNRDKSMALFLDAVRLLFEGRFGQALKKAGEAHAQGFAPGMSALVAARAAQRMREDIKQREWLRRAVADDQNSEAATLMLDAEMLNETRDFEEALVVLRKLQEKHGRHLAALRLELRARQGAGHWDDVLRLARMLEKRGAVLPELAVQIRYQAHAENIRLRAGDEGRLLAYLRNIPASEQTARLTAVAAHALHALDAHNEVATLIEAQLGRGDDAARWNDELVTLYGKLAGGDRTARLGQAEKWLAQRPNDENLLLALGRLCIGQRLWGKAQSYLEASLAVAPSTAAHLELARLFDSLGRQEEANRHFRLSVDQGA